MDAVWVMFDEEGKWVRAYSSKNRAEEDLDLMSDREGHTIEELPMYHGAVAGFRGLGLIPESVRELRMGVEIGRA